MRSYVIDIGKQWEIPAGAYGFCLIPSVPLSSPGSLITLPGEFPLKVSFPDNGDPDFIITNSETVYFDSPRGRMVVQEFGKRFFSHQTLNRSWRVVVLESASEYYEPGRSRNFTTVEVMEPIELPLYRPLPGSAEGQGVFYVPNNARKVRLYFEGTPQAVDLFVDYGNSHGVWKHLKQIPAGTNDLEMDVVELDVIFPGKAIAVVRTDSVNTLSGAADAVLELG